MDEQRNKMTEKELENVAGGIVKRFSFRCEKCGFEFTTSDFEKYADSGSNGSTHKGCGGSIEVKIY